MDRARIERLEADLALRFTSGNSVSVERAHITAADYDTIRALLRLARAVADAHQGTVSQVEWEDSDRIIPHIDKDEGDVLMWQDIAQGQRVLLLRADAVEPREVGSSNSGETNV